MSEEEAIKLIQELKRYGAIYTDNQYYMLYKHDIEKLVSYIEQLQQENDKLKKELEITTFNFKSLSSACGSLAEFMGLDKDSIIEEMIDKVVKDRKEKDLYKSVLKEIREYIAKRIYFPPPLEEDTYFEKVVSFTDNELDKLLEIIDKGIGEDNG